MRVNRSKNNVWLCTVTVLIFLVFQSSSHQWAVACRSSCPRGDAGILMVDNINFFSLLVTFLSFDVKEWVVENDLLVQRLKVSIKVY